MSTVAGYTARQAKTGEAIQLAMQRLWLTGQVLPVGAQLFVQHVFRSAEQQPLEVIYSFPLPRDAALRRFRISGDGFEVESELQPREEAARMYEQGLEQGSLAALAAAYQDGVVNLTVGNIRPGETITVDLEIVAGVELNDNGFRLRFPFTLAPAYHRAMRAIAIDEGVGEWELPRGEFGDVVLPPVHKDASGLHETGFDLEVAVSGEISGIASPSHPVRLRAKRVALATTADIPNRDLVLDVEYAGKEARVLEGEGAFAAVIPSTAFGERTDGARRVVILLDRSGSMGGAPIDQARKAITACLAVLSEKDKFGLVAFDDQVETFHRALISGTRENRDQARDFLTGINARGGTELVNGFEAAAALLADGGGDVFVLTDGQVAGTEAILARARSGEVRLHSLGIGSASQDRFLSLLARETGGVSRFVTARERVDLAAVDLFASIGRPVASELKVGGNVEPPAPRFVLGGTPVLLFGEGPSESVELTWTGNGRLQLPAATSHSSAVRLLQGSRLITDAESREESTDQLLALSRRFGLASKAMSLVAVVKRAGDVAGDLPVSRVVPVGMPQDVPFGAYFALSYKMVGGAPAAPAPMQAAYLLDSVVAPAPSGIAAKARGLRRLFSRVGEARTASPPPPPQPPDDEDRLMDLAARMEPDGGMPGKDIDERVRNTVEALRAFAEAGHTLRSGAFRSHVNRLVEFLKAAQIPPPLQGMVDDAVKKVT